MTQKLKKKKNILSFISLFIQFFMHLKMCSENRAIFLKNWNLIVYYFTVNKTNNNQKWIIKLN